MSKDLPSDRPNGVSCQVHRLANELVARGHHVTCLSFSPKPEDAGYDHVALTWGGGSKLVRKFVPAIRFRGIKTGIFDIVHYHGDDYLSPGGGKRVRTFYGSALSEALSAESLSRTAYQGLFYLFEWVSCLRGGTKVGISTATKRVLPLVKKIIPCGVDTRRYAPGGDRSAHPSILFVGDLRSRKRGSMLLDVFENTVLPQHPRCELVVVGPEECAGTNVRYAGRVGESALIEEYRKAWVYCMASSYEGFGVPAIEAMACGTPVVATVNAGITEVIQRNYNGLLADDGELGETLCRLLSDKVLRDRIRVNATRTVSKKFDIRTVARLYEELYESAGAGR